MYKEKIKEIDKKTAALEFEREEIMMEWVKTCHPVKVGERITVNFPVCYKEKLMEVYHVDVRETPKGFYFVAFGRVVEKNGRSGTMAGEWRQEC